MCLFKVYLDGRKLAEGVAVAEKRNGKLRLFNSALREVASLENVELVKVDTLNELILLREA
ncbi:hypothetical protein DRO53_00635 [Candidatus Bathyarchaeota archaeon]|nr:MAG: hypothetical protein DRO53_00635 [Candidatus Bathyarchaeota archaeon]